MLQRLRSFIARHRSLEHYRLFLGIVVVLFVARLALPSMVRSQVNRILGRHADYRGEVADIRINLWRGAYAIDGLRLMKREGTALEPFVSIGSLEFSIQASALLHGAVVADASMRDVDVTFVRSEDPRASQTSIDPDWRTTLTDLFPFRLDDLRVFRGRVRFKDLRANPAVDVDLGAIQARLRNLTNVRKPPAKGAGSGMRGGRATEANDAKDAKDADVAKAKERDEQAGPDGEAEPGADARTETIAEAEANAAAKAPARAGAKAVVRADGAADGKSGEAGEAKKKRTAEKTLVATLEAVGLPMGRGTFWLSLQFDPFATEPTFDLDAAIEGLDLVAVNDFLRAYAQLDVERGTFDLYTELAAAHGRVSGYVKPFFHDLEVVTFREATGPRQALQALWEAVAGALATGLENSDTRKLATKIPVQGRLESGEVDTASAVVGLLRNAFLRALAPGVDRSITLDDAKAKQTDQERRAQADDQERTRSKQRSTGGSAAKKEDER